MALSTLGHDAPLPKVAIACEWCRHRRIRCDGQTPCGPCVSRGRECEYSKDPPKKRGPKPKALKEALLLTSLGAVGGDDESGGDVEGGGSSVRSAARRGSSSSRRRVGVDDGGGGDGNYDSDHMADIGGASDAEGRGGSDVWDRRERSASQTLAALAAIGRSPHSRTSPADGDVEMRGMASVMPPPPPPPVPTPSAGGYAHLHDDGKPHLRISVPSAAGMAATAPASHVEHAPRRSVGGVAAAAGGAHATRQLLHHLSPAVSVTPVPPTVPAVHHHAPRGHTAPLPHATMTTPHAGLGIGGGGSSSVSGGGIASLSSSGAGGGTLPALRASPHALVQYPVPSLRDDRAINAFCNNLNGSVSLVSEPLLRRVIALWTNGRSARALEEKRPRFWWCAHAEMEPQGELLVPSDFSAMMAGALGHGVEEYVHLPALDRAQLATYYGVLAIGYRMLRGSENQPPADAPAIADGHYLRARALALSCMDDPSVPLCSALLLLSHYCCGLLRLVDASLHCSAAWRFARAVGLTVDDAGLGTSIRFYRQTVCNDLDPVPVGPRLLPHLHARQLAPTPLGYPPHHAAAAGTRSHPGDGAGAASEPSTSPTAAADGADLATAAASAASLADPAVAVSAVAMAVPPHPLLGSSRSYIRDSEGSEDVAMRSDGARAHVMGAVPPVAPTGGPDSLDGDGDTAMSGSASSVGRETAATGNSVSQSPPPPTSLAALERSGVMLWGVGEGPKTQATMLLQPALTASAVASVDVPAPARSVLSMTGYKIDKRGGGETPPASCAAADSAAPAPAPASGAAAGLRTSSSRTATSGSTSSSSTSATAATDTVVKATGSGATVSFAPGGPQCWNGLALQPTDGGGSGGGAAQPTEADVAADAAAAAMVGPDGLPLVDYTCLSGRDPACGLYIPSGGDVIVMAGARVSVAYLNVRVSELMGHSISRMMHLRRGLLSRAEKREMWARVDEMHEIAHIPGLMMGPCRRATIYGMKAITARQAGDREQAAFFARCAVHLWASIPMAHTSHSFIMLFVARHAALILLSDELVETMEAVRAKYLDAPQPHSQGHPQGQGQGQGQAADGAAGSAPSSRGSKGGGSLAGDSEGASDTPGSTPAVFATASGTPSLHGPPHKPLKLSSRHLPTLPALDEYAGFNAIAYMLGSVARHWPITSRMYLSMMNEATAMVKSSESTLIATIGRDLGMAPADIARLLRHKADREAALAASTAATTATPSAASTHSGQDTSSRGRSRLSGAPPPQSVRLTHAPATSAAISDAGGGGGDALRAVEMLDSPRTIAAMRHAVGGHLPHLHDPRAARAASHLTLPGEIAGESANKFAWGVVDRTSGVTSVDASDHYVKHVYLMTSNLLSSDEGPSAEEVGGRGGGGWSRGGHSIAAGSDSYMHGGATAFSGSGHSAGGHSQSLSVDPLTGLRMVTVNVGGAGKMTLAAAAGHGRRGSSDGSSTTTSSSSGGASGGGAASDAVAGGSATVSGGTSSHFASPLDLLCEAIVRYSELDSGAGNGGGGGSSGDGGLVGVLDQLVTATTTGAGAAGGGGASNAKVAGSGASPDAHDAIGIAGAAGAASASSSSSGGAGGGGKRSRRDRSGSDASDTDSEAASVSSVISVHGSTTSEFTGVGAATTGGGQAAGAASTMGGGGPSAGVRLHAAVRSAQGLGTSSSASTPTGASTHSDRDSGMSRPLSSAMLSGADLRDGVSPRRAAAHIAAMAHHIDLVEQQSDSAPAGVEHHGPAGAAAAAASFIGRVGLALPPPIAGAAGGGRTMSTLSDVSMSEVPDSAADMHAHMMAARAAALAASSAAALSNLAANADRNLSVAPGMSLSAAPIGARAPRVGSRGDGGDRAGAGSDRQLSTSSGLHQHIVPGLDRMRAEEAASVAGDADGSNGGGGIADDSSGGSGGIGIGPIPATASAASTAILSTMLAEMQRGAGAVGGRQSTAFAPTSPEMSPEDGEQLLGGMEPAPLDGAGAAATAGDAASTSLTALAGWSGASSGATQLTTFRLMAPPPDQREALARPASIAGVKRSHDGTVVTKRYASVGMPADVAPPSAPSSPDLHSMGGLTPLLQQARSQMLSAPASGGNGDGRLAALPSGPRFDAGSRVAYRNDSLGAMQPGAAATIAPVSPASRFADAQRVREALGREVSLGLIDPAVAATAASAQAPAAKRVRLDPGAPAAAAAAAAVPTGSASHWSMQLGEHHPTNRFGGGFDAGRDDGGVSAASPFTSLDDTAMDAFSVMRRGIAQHSSGATAVPAAAIASPSEVVHVPSSTLRAAATSPAAAGSPTGYLRLIMEQGDGRSSVASPASLAGGSGEGGGFTHAFAPTPPSSVPRAAPSNSIRLGGSGGGGGGTSTPRPSPLSSRGGTSESATGIASEGHAEGRQ